MISWIDWHAYLVLILVGLLPNEVWRMLGVMLARGIDEDSEVLVWVRAWRPRCWPALSRN